MQSPGFDILYEQGPCLVINKPGGVLTQAPPGIDSIESRIKRFIKLRDDKPGKVYLGVPHRLDRPVSGAMVFARHVRAAKRICQQFEDRTVTKTYWAMVHGHLDPAEGTFRDWIRKIPEVAASELVGGEAEGAQTAVLHYRQLHRLDQATLLQIALETGRTHQIRAQCAWHGHPIIGDRQYGSLLNFGPETHNERERLIALHARRLAFRHPMTREPVDITAPLPSWWEAFELPYLQP
jgi:23S rRNA pseudouridine1911/1915/1917 synthase